MTRGKGKDFVEFRVRRQRNPVRSLCRRHNHKPLSSTKDMLSRLCSNRVSLKQIFMSHSMLPSHCLCCSGFVRFSKVAPYTGGRSTTTSCMATTSSPSSPSSEIQVTVFECMMTPFQLAAAVASMHGLQLVVLAMRCYEQEYPVLFMLIYDTLEYTIMTWS